MLPLIHNLLHRYICSRLSFRKRVWLLLVILVTVQLSLVFVFFHRTLANTLEHQISTRAVVQAREIASDPQLIEEVKRNNLDGIQREIKRLQGISDANFIVVGDQDGIRLAHPDEKKIGLKMKGGDNRRALEQGEHYYSYAKGSLGRSIRGKSPIVTQTGEVIGVVSVGYLQENISDWMFTYLQPLSLTLLMILFATSFGAWVFTRHIKSQMYNMEPEEIALAFRVQKSVLQAVYEGVIAVDGQGRILSVNKRALSILGIAYPPGYLVGRQASEFITPADFFTGRNQRGELAPADMKDELIACNGETLIANRVNIWEDEPGLAETVRDHAGWVVSFRKRDDLNTLTSQLSQIHQHTDNLRVLSHEHANRLSTIGGLIQIGAYAEALKAIRSETEDKQQLIDYIAQTFRSRVIAGQLLGKYCRAKELGLTLEFDPCCELNADPVNITPDELAAVVGNLLDNAFEATLKNPDSHQTISILLTDAGDELVIEVADNGPGIPDNIADSLFTKGVSSKNQPGHGIGLYLVHSFVTQAGGSILVDDAEPQGTIFSLFIPNTISNNHKSCKDGTF
ncbi:sensor histidine kinase [Photobacterium sp. MCCC 1A19761]|uniref:sensor histidine kinase n=1 Tax=Photobacterium sp. MCCC 1A19761 TaxID=3115000 RepID=UPI00307D2554